MKTPFSIFLGGLLAGLLFSTAHAIPVSVDAGTDGWTGWVRTPDPNTVDSGSFLNSSGTSMDSGGSSESWGLYGQNSETGAAVYDFGGVLGVGETVSIDVSLGFIDSGATVGFSLQNSSGINRFEAYYIGGDAVDSWKLNDADGQEDIVGPATDFGNSSWKIAGDNFLSFRFTQLAGNQFELSVDGVDATNSNLNLAASDISQIRIFNFNAGSGSDNDQYFNNLEVVPEAETTLLLLGGLGIILWFRRRYRG